MYYRFILLITAFFCLLGSRVNASELGLDNQSQFLSGGEKAETSFFSESVTDDGVSFFTKIVKRLPARSFVMRAIDFPVDGTSFFKEKESLVIGESNHHTAETKGVYNGSDGMYDLVFVAAGDDAGQTTFEVLVNGHTVGRFSAPLGKQRLEEGAQYLDLWENISLVGGDEVTVIARAGSEDGLKFSSGRWYGLLFIPMTKGKEVIGLAVSDFQQPKTVTHNASSASERSEQSDSNNMGTDGDGTVAISGELKQWHKVTLTLDGPFASEANLHPNPFTDYRMTVIFTHESGFPTYKVPAYFAADGNAGESGASQGNKWRAHLSPDKIGKWSYHISFLQGAMVATADMPWMKTLTPYDGIEGSFVVAPTDKTGRDFRAKGRLEYVGEHYLQFKGSGDYFYKVGADAPETLLAYEDFDNTVAMKPKVPLKSFSAHVKDYNEGDPSWRDGKGKGLIGAINYLAAKGVNAFSFLTYNAGGDGDNVWPFVSRNDKFHYDCSKLDQWQMVFDHAQRKGLYLHFKTQETENDDNIRGHNKQIFVPESLDGGDLGPERRLYYRELIARFGYLLALNWNLGEENTQSEENIRLMAEYFTGHDPYHHNIVLHTFPNEQDKKYTPLLGSGSDLTGVSLQNEWNVVFRQTLKWVAKSDSAGRPWVVANDEQGSAARGVPPDPGYNGFDASKVGYTIDDIRKQTLWGNIMAGGAGVEYYFGYRFPENDLLLQDFRSRDKSWDFCRIAVDFLSRYKIPLPDMHNADALIGNTDMNKEKHCLANEGEIYLVYLAYTETTSLDLTGVSGSFSVDWFNPATGGELQKGSVRKVKGGRQVDLGIAPASQYDDWVILVRKK